jgi:hypothetical protein
MTFCIMTFIRMVLNSVELSKVTQDGI